MTETYENIRDSELLTQDTRESFIRADQARRGLRREYEKLIEDESLNDEYRARRAQELFEQRKESVGAQGRRAREAILKQAKFAEQAATLRPSGEPLSSSSADRLLLDQNEAARIVRSSARRSPRGRSAPTLAATSVKSTLVDWRSAGSKADRYVAAPWRAAGELGVSQEEIIAPLRDDNHREALDKARRLQWFSDIVSTTAPPIPRKLDGRNSKSRVAGSYRSAPSALVPGAAGPPIMASTDSAGAKKKTRRKKNFS